MGPHGYTYCDDNIHLLRRINFDKLQRILTPGFVETNLEKPHVQQAQVRLLKKKNYY